MIGNQHVYVTEGADCGGNYQRRCIGISEVGLHELDARTMLLQLLLQGFQAAAIRAPGLLGIVGCERMAEYVAPIAASLFATAKPMPLRRLTPVTNAARPVKTLSMLCLDVSVLA